MKMKKKAIGILVSIVVLFSVIWFLKNLLYPGGAPSYCYGKLQIPCFWNIGLLYIPLIVASYVYQIRNSIASKTKVKLITKVGLIAIVFSFLSVIGNIYADQHADMPISMGLPTYVIFYLAIDILLGTFIVIGALMFFWPE